MRKTSSFTVALLLVLLAACGSRSGAPTSAAAALVAGGRTAKLCAEPGAGWEARAPEGLGLDAATLQDAFDWANQHSGLSMAVYRHGCLAGVSRLDPLTGDQAMDGWSMTKSVTAMIVGRAVTLGLLDVDAPISRWWPEADEAHGRLTLRQLMTETAGMDVNYIRELNPAMPDRVKDALSLRFNHEPGAVWEYAQTVCDLVLNTVGRAAGRDAVEFAQEQLFAPLGIAVGSYTWERDRAGNPQGWAHLKMRNPDWARLAHMMLWNGVWNGQQLISPDYIREALTGVADNPAYGFLFWLNGGAWWRVPAVEGPDQGEGSVLPAGPDDLFGFIGIGEQRMFVIPSRDLVIVRLGDRGSFEPDTRVLLFSGRAGQVDHEILRRVLLAVTDVAYTDPGPYESAGLVLPPLDDGILADALEYYDVLGGFGLGPNATPGCTPLGC